MATEERSGAENHVFLLFSGLRFVARLLGCFPPAQFGRYLAVGIVNTVFGYGSFALLTFALDSMIPHGYLVAGFLSVPLNITVSYLNYKFFVFKTKSNYIREWIRCVAVYSSSMVLGAALLPVVVFLIRRLTHFNAAAPYIAGAILTGFSALSGFLGHRRFSFASPTHNHHPTDVLAHNASDQCE